jgi:hypothetical protein
MRTELSAVRRVAAIFTILAIATPISNLTGALAAPTTTQGAESKPAAGQQTAGPRVDPRAQQILRRACSTLTDARTFTFHAEVTFEQVLPDSPVKLQFAGATDYAVRKPGALAVDFESDLGAKRFWYNGTTLTIFDAPKMMYTSTTVPASIDGMMERIAEGNNLTLPLGDLAMSNPCASFSKNILFGSHVGRGDVAGVACDHLAFTASNIDWQVWIQHSGKPLPRKIVINYRLTPGAPEYVAVISDWKFPATIPDSRFTPQIPQKALRIKFVDLKEPRP